MGFLPVISTIRGNLGNIKHGDVVDYLYWFLPLTLPAYMASDVWRQMVWVINSNGKGVRWPKGLGRRRVIAL